MNNARFDSDNLIYNRFDLIHKNDYQILKYDCDGLTYTIMTHNSNGEVSVNLWGKELPQHIFNRLIQHIFQDEAIYSIRFNRCRNNYKYFFNANNDIRVPVEDEPENILLRVERRDRATIRRKERWLDERVGKVSIAIQSGDAIPQKWVEKYFEWKMDSHNTDYKLSPMEYLEKYYVTHAMLFSAGDTDVAVAFWCENEGIAFFENFSYNPELRDYSPGLLIYVKLLEELCRRKCKYLYLGGGNYIYKKRFNSEESLSFSGIIYRDEILEAMNSYYKKRGISTIAIYGYGTCGRDFFQVSNELDLDVLYAIDKKASEDGSIKIVRPEEELPEVDAIIITLNSHNDEVEQLVTSLNENNSYWIDDRDRILENYSKGKSNNV